MSYYFKVLAFICLLLSPSCGQEEIDNQRGYRFEGEPRKVLDQQSEAQISADAQAGDQITVGTIAADSQDGDTISLPAEAEGNPPPSSPTPPTAFTGFSSYRIQVLEMQQDCSGDTVNIEEIRLQEDGKLLSDTFKDYPDSPNPNFNKGRIGSYEVELTSSGDFDNFYPFEAFGGGFGAGWFSARDSFADNMSPAPAIQDVWLNISFGDVPVKLEKIFINGGSSKLNTFSECAPSEVEILATLNPDKGWYSLAKLMVNSSQGVEIPLSIPLEGAN